MQNENPGVPPISLQGLFPYFSMLPVGISILDREGQLVFQNTALQKILDLREEDIATEKYHKRKYIHKDFREFQSHEFPSYVALTEKGEVNDVDIGIVKEDEDIIWVDADARWLPEFECTVLITHDRTHERKLERDLARRNAFFQSILDQIPGIVGHWDSNLRCTFANQRYVEYFGRTPQEIVGMRMVDLLGEPLFLKNKIYASNALAGITQQFERSLTKASGEVVHTLAQYLPDIDNGRVRGFFVLVTDVTALKNLESQAAMQASIVEYSDDAIVGLSLDEKIISWNRGAERLFQYTRSEILGESIGVLLPSDRKTEESELIARIRNGEVISQYETLRLRKDGMTVEVAVTVSGVRDESGQIVRISKVARDIGERKKLEREIQELNHGLEAKVLARTKQLKEANNELEAFSYSIAHDLRSPLRAINGFAEILAQDYAHQLDDGGKRYCQILVNEALRMGQLIDDLLAFSKLSRQKLNFVDTDMDALVRGVILELQQQGMGNETEFVFRGIPSCRCAPELVRQVWVNLISNAIKFTSKVPNPVVEIGGERQDGVCEFYVRDNGAGFDMEYADKLFGVFQRLHPESEFAGTGVGLAIVKRIIHRHGGAISAEAAIGKGATFRFTIPQHLEEE